MKTITYDETKFKLVPVESDTLSYAAVPVAPQSIPQAMALYYELAGIDADISYGGLAAFDEVCWRTLQRVMMELRKIGQTSPDE